MAASSTGATFQSLTFTSLAVFFRLLSSLPRQKFVTVVIVAQVKLQVFRACGEGSFHGISVNYRRIFYDVTLPRQRKNWSIMAASGRNCRRSLMLQA